MAITTRELDDDDATLVAAVQSGESDAFAELFRRHYPSVRRACAHRLRDLGEADEVAQAAFVRALERIDRCGGERRFGGWVHVIAERMCIDAARARTRTMPQEEPVAPERAIAPHGPEDELLRAQLVRDLRDAIATLPPRQREVLVARDVDERRPPEIAAALGLSLGAVDSLLLRARRRLAGAYRATAGEQGAVNTASTAAIASAGATDAPRAVGRALVAAANAAHDLAVQLAANGASAAAVAKGVKRVAVAAAAAFSLAVPGASLAPSTPAPARSHEPAVATGAVAAPGADVRHRLRDRLVPDGPYREPPAPGAPDVAPPGALTPTITGPSAPGAPAGPGVPTPPALAVPAPPAAPDAVHAGGPTVDAAEPGAAESSPPVPVGPVPVPTAAVPEPVPLPAAPVSLPSTDPLSAPPPVAP